MQVFLKVGEKMRRSRSDAAQTREQIVSTATKMFLERGLEAVGMRDIMAAAGLTPGAFYRHFESKQQLIAEANDAAFDRLLTMFETRIVDKSSLEALETIVVIYLNQSQREGNTYLCPLSMIGVELSHCGPEVREVAMNGYQRLVQLLADRLPHLGKDEALAASSGLVSTMVGAVVLSNIASDKATARSILSDAHALIRAWLSSEESLSHKRRAGGIGRSQRPRPRLEG
jgi:TetR/AcrR family transcriptional regulator, transcriptional repressor for nem operon